MESPALEPLFGDMFEEPETGVVQGCAPNPSTKVDGNKVEAPPPGRGETGFCGIKNQGATCYLNSLIQTLLLTPELKEELFRLGPDELGKLEDIKKKNAKVRKIPIQLQMLLARLLLLNQYACGTEGLTESFGWVDSETLQQHDVQELSRILFCAIEDSLVGTSGHDIIKNLYRGVSANTITCLSCGKVSENTEDFLDLNIAIATQSNLCAVLRDMFVETELMNGKNQYRCDQCQKLVDARKGAIIKTLPSILTISLLRFSFDYNTCRRFKETRKFNFPLSLSMKPYCEKSSNSQNECYDYELYSVIIHSGSAHGGHYHAYIRDIDGLGTVPPDYNPTPPKINPASPEKSDDYIDDPLEMIAYILGKLGGENIPLNKLGEAFREESGTSWGKQYRRKYGTMTKFLQSCYDTFTVDNRSKTVSFRTKCKRPIYSISSNESAYKGHSNPNGSSDSILNGETSPPTTPKSNGVTHVGNGDMIDETCENGVSDDDDLSYDTDTHPLCNIWFDFNDSRVRPITTHDIEKQFEGRESAYMLFYRRKDLKRPLESLGNSLNGIPDHIRARIQEENCNLDELRTEYDFYLNVVTLRVFFPGMLKLENGLLKLVEDKDVSECGFSYSIDRRKKIGEMMTELMQMAEKHHEDTPVVDGKKLQCNILKVLEHGGVHVYDRVDLDHDIVVGNSTLENGLNLILWDGEKLQNVNIKPGKESEPIMLDVHCKTGDGSCLMSFDFKGVAFGNVKLPDLKQFFLDKFKLQNVTQSKIGNCDKNGDLCELSETDLTKTLGEITLSREEKIMLEISLSDIEFSPHNDEIDFFTFRISPGEIFERKLLEAGYFCSPHDVFTQTAISGVMSVSSFIHVEHLKFSVLHWLLPELKHDYKLEDLHLYVVRDASSDVLVSSKLCIHEKQSLCQAGLTNDVDSIRLEIGPPPDRKQFHVTVYIQRGSKLKFPVKKSQAVLAKLTKTRTVAQFIEKLTEENNLSNEPRHLRLLKSEKEVGEIISDLSHSVERTCIKHGCSLVLCPGGISSDGQIRIPIYYYPDFTAFNDILSEIDQLPDQTVWNTSIQETVVEPALAGHVEIGKDSTLFELKQEIVKLEYFVEKEMSDIETICLRSISYKLPTRFHLQENSGVKRLHLGINTPIAVQNKTALPPIECATLFLTFQTPGTRIYSNTCEFIWEKTQPLSQLPSKLSAELHIPLKEILTAKRGDETRDWEIIKSRDSDQRAKDQKSKQKKASTKQKKASGKAKNKKPGHGKTASVTTVFAQNGDVIRIKRITTETQNSEGPEVSDFRSEEDILAMKKLQESRTRETDNTQSKNDRGDSENNSQTPPKQPIEKKSSTPKKEETLHIHVDKF